MPGGQRKRVSEKDRQWQTDHQTDTKTDRVGGGGGGKLLCVCWINKELGRSHTHTHTTATTTKPLSLQPTLTVALPSAPHGLAPDTSSSITPASFIALGTTPSSSFTEIQTKYIIYGFPMFGQAAGVQTIEQYNWWVILTQDPNTKRSKRTLIYFNCLFVVAVLWGFCLFLKFITCLYSKEKHNITGSISMLATKTLKAKSWNQKIYDPVLSTWCKYCTHRYLF